MWALLPIIGAIVPFMSKMFARSLIAPTVFGELTQATSILQLVIAPIVIALFILPSRHTIRWSAILLALLSWIVLISVYYLPNHMWHPAYLSAVTLLGLIGIVSLSREPRLHYLWRSVA